MLLECYYLIYRRRMKCQFGHNPRTYIIERVEESRYVESASGKNANLKTQIYNLCQSQAAGGRMPGCDLVLMMAH